MVCSYFKILFLVCKDLGLVCFGTKPFGKERKTYNARACVCVRACVRISEGLFFLFFRRAFSLPCNSIIIDSD